MNKFTICAIIILSLISCKSPSEEPSIDQRPFLMGFTPWPYDATTDAVEWTYEKISEHSDIISHHMEEGVPWPEAYDNSAFSSEFQTEIDSRLERIEPGMSVLLSVSPLNMGRDAMALYRGSRESMALPAPWDSYALNSTEVKTAYLQYVNKMVDAFQPDYLIIGVEVNLLIRNNPDLWPEYVELHSYVYGEIKQDYPELPVGASFFCVPFFPEWSPEDDLNLQVAGLRDIETTSDFIAFSLHPFMSALTAESFPDDYMETLFAQTDKPVAISESSYPAEYWQTLSEPVVDFNGTPEKQAAFLSEVFQESEMSNALFLIWFSIRDFDALWEGVLNEDPVALVWRDTGLYDGEGNRRIAYDIWEEWFFRIP